MHSRRYSAFISYRQADNTQEGRRWAEWLHRALERYVIPPDLISTPNLRDEPIRDSLYPIFRDEDELPANADLATGIRAALEVSDHLIVLCSPRSAVSPWVRKEVREFKELGRSDRILAIIIAGEPNADAPAKAREGIMRDEECFCEELRYGAMREDGTLGWTARAEPLAADLRPTGTRAEGFVTAEAYREHLTLNSSLAPEKIAARTEAYRQQLDQGLLKVIAGLLGVPLGQLKDRDAAHRTALAEAEAVKQREIAERERQLAEHARRSAAEAQQAKLAAEHTARRLGIAGAVTLVLALLAGWFWWQSGQAKLEETKQRRVAEQRGADLGVERTKLKEKLHEASMADYAVAVQRIEKDNKWPEGVAHLARSLKWEPANPLAAIRLYATLSFYAAEKQAWPREILRHESGVTSAQFSADGTRIVTASWDNTARVWDGASGKPLGEPLRHEDSVRSAQFSPDGTRIVTANKKNTARVWDVGTMLHLPLPVPEWVLQRARAIAGLEFDADGQTKTISGEQRIAILREPVLGDDSWAKLARWLVLPANERTITPDSKFTCLQIAERERDSGFKEGLESSLRYDPTVPLAHLMLAKFEENPQRADFLRDYELKRLPEDAALWTRAATSLVEQKDFKRALQAAEKALKLGPLNAEAKKALEAAKQGGSGK